MGGGVGRAILDLARSASVVVVMGNVDPADDSADATVDFPSVPLQFLRAVTFAQVALERSAPSRDPVLAFDGGRALTAFVVPGSVADAFLVAKFSQDFSVEQFPPSPYRWVVAMDPSGDAYRVQIGSTSTRVRGSA